MNSLTLEDVNVGDGVRFTALDGKSVDGTVREIIARSFRPVGVQFEGETRVDFVALERLSLLRPASPLNEIGSGGTEDLLGVAKEILATVRLIALADDPQLESALAANRDLENLLRVTRQDLTTEQERRDRAEAVLGKVTYALSGVVGELRSIFIEDEGETPEDQAAERVISRVDALISAALRAPYER